MTAHQLDLLGPAFDRIGQEAVRLAGGEADKLFMYVEIGDGWVDPSLFKDEGATLRYIGFPPTTPLYDLLTKAWCLEPADKRWTAMRYAIDRGRFGAEFDFDDFRGLEEDTGDRRERILRARYGDKPVVYPPLPAGGWELTPK